MVSVQAQWELPPFGGPLGLGPSRHEQEEETGCLASS